MDALEMCARDLSDALQQLQKLDAENAKLKNQNKRLREIIEVCQRYFDNQRVTDAWADNIKMDIDDSMGDLGMEEIK